MKSWLNKRLGDVLTFQRGFDITKNEQSEGIIPIVSSSGISSFHNKFKVSGPGVVTGRKGTLGKVHYISENHWPHDTTLWIKDFKGNLPRFIYYYLSIMRLENYDVGASNPTLNRNHLHKLKILWPSPHIQHKIAAILSAYDELIENNNRRIAILEKMAEEIYREWFVRLRFPGHENTKIVKGVPEGWEVKKVGDLFQLKRGKVISSKDLISGAVPVIGGGISFSSYHNKANTVSPTITISASGANAGYVNIYFENVWASDCAFIDTTITKSIYYAYLLLKSKQNEITYLQKGSAQPHVYAKDVMDLGVLAPDSNLTANFGSVINPIFNEIRTLRKSLDLLKTTRDLLLPRLISGKLDVENLDIAFPPGMEEEGK